MGSFARYTESTFAWDLGYEHLFTDNWGYRSGLRIFGPITQTPGVVSTGFHGSAIINAMAQAEYTYPLFWDVCAIAGAGPMVLLNHKYLDRWLFNKQHSTMAVIAATSIGLKAFLPLQTVNGKMTMEIQYTPYINFSPFAASGAAMISFGAGF